jgi:hypothetical protein
MKVLSKLSPIINETFEITLDLTPAFLEMVYYTPRTIYAVSRALFDTYVLNSEE